MLNTAVFIDGDNIHINNLRFNILFDNIISKDNVIIKRVYGDWKLESMNTFWDKHILDNSLEEIQISRLSGKNSTDSKIIVDAMDLIINTNHIDKIILIGCDKDYIPLIRYAIQYNYEFEVFGLIKQTSPSIINACTKFYDIDNYLNLILNNNYDNNYDDVQNDNMECYENDNSFDESFNVLNECIPDEGISISELKRKIRDINKKELFGKEYRTLNIFINNNYKHYFDVRMKKGRLMIYKLN